MPPSFVYSFLYVISTCLKLLIRGYTVIFPSFCQVYRQRDEDLVLLMLRAFVLVSTSAFCQIHFRVADSLR